MTKPEATTTSPKAYQTAIWVDNPFPEASVALSDKLSEGKPRTRFLVATLLAATFPVSHAGASVLTEDYIWSGSSAETLGTVADIASWRDRIETPPTIHSENTTCLVRDREAESSFQALFERAAELRFEDGMETEFSLELSSLVRFYGGRSKDILARLFENKSIASEVWSEALRWLGRLDDAASHEGRLWILERGLCSSSPVIRDGAALGLASMDAPKAIPYLQRAIQLETINELRSDMEQVLLQLQRS